MTAPMPTAEAVDALARTIWQGAVKTAAWDDDPWENQREGVKHSIRANALTLLAAAYPQIAADVLDHYAERAADEGQWHAEAYLRDQADEVRP